MINIEKASLLRSPIKKEQFSVKNSDTSGEEKCFK